MKKKLSVLFLLPLILTGCSEKTSATPTTPADNTYVPQIKEKTTIELWSITGQNNQVQLQSYIDEFRKLEPNQYH